MQSEIPSPVQKHFALRLFWLIALTLIGIIPILLAITWIEGNMTLPGDLHRLFQAKFGWPWLSFEESALPIRLAVDLVLVLAAYLLTPIATTLKSRETRQALTMITLGGTLFIAMSMWQYTGVMIWAFRTPYLLNELIYTAFFAAFASFYFNATGLARLFGYSQLYSEERTDLKIPPPPKKESVFLALSFLLTGALSLDRFLFSAVSLSFLFFFWKQPARDSSKSI